MIGASTGNIIKDYLSENHISIDELSKTANVSSRNIYRLFNDEIPLSYEVAEAINALIPEVSVDFLMVYEARYQIEKKKFMKDIGISDLSGTISYFELDKLYPDLKGNQILLIKQGIEDFGLKALQSRTISSDDISFLGLSLQYSKAKNSKDNLSILWTISAYKNYINSKDLLIFNEEEFNRMFTMIKDLCGTTNIKSTLYNMERFCKKCGINFDYRDNLPGARIKAVTIKDENGKVFIFVSSLFKSIENLWLSFIHEALHIKNKDYDNSELADEKSDSTIENERFISDEVIRYLLEDDLNIIVNLPINKMIGIAKERNIPDGIIAEIYRYVNKKYNDATINSYIHYYDL